VDDNLVVKLPDAGFGAHRVHGRHRRGAGGGHAGADRVFVEEQY
jgi:hypothetical protein